MAGKARRWRWRALPLLIGVALGLALLMRAGSGPAAAVVPPNGMVCTDGTVTDSVVKFSLRATDGYISTPDGNSLYMWSYAIDQDEDTVFQYTGPTLCVNEDYTVVVELANDLPDPVSIIFPGQTNVHVGEGLGGPLAQPQFDGGDLTSLTNVAAADGGSVTYSFKAEEPGTYIYHSGTDPHKQQQMGLIGALVVRPSLGAGYAYNDSLSAFNTNREFLLLFHEIDPALHQAVELGRPYNITTLHFRYWTINGRSMPDTLAPNSAPWLPGQPYGALVTAEPYDPADNPLPVLARIANAGMASHPFHPHASHVRVIAQDGRLLKGPADEDLSLEKFTRTTGAGQTVDALFAWADVEGWRPTGEPESGIQCSNDLDDDEDEKINDGCPAVGAPLPESGSQCNNATDDDGDGKINDGCPADLTSESGGKCNNAKDDDKDGKVNDGCPTAGGVPETGAQCDNALNDDSPNDTKVNDGCPIVPNPEPLELCSNNKDDDKDGKVNDGCPTVGVSAAVAETGTECDNGTDDEDNAPADGVQLDGRVNDGCPTAGANPIPVQIPGLQNLIFKDDVTFYSGSPYLGYQDELPVGVTSYNQCGEEYFPWHTHALNEFQNFDEGFGGLGTAVVVFPPGGCP